MVKSRPNEIVINTRPLVNEQPVLSYLWAWSTDNDGDTIQANNQLI